MEKEIKTDSTLNPKILDAAVDWWCEQLSGKKINWNNGAHLHGTFEEKLSGGKNDDPW